MTTRDESDGSEDGRETTRGCVKLARADGEVILGAGVSTGDGAVKRTGATAVLGGDRMVMVRGTPLVEPVGVTGETPSPLSGVLPRRVRCTTPREAAAVLGAGPLIGVTGRTSCDSEGDWMRVSGWPGFSTVWPGFSTVWPGFRTV